MSNSSIIEYFPNGYITYFTENTTNVICESWILLEGENLWNRYFRIGLYLFSIVYIFVGISIAADMFMASIERITSTKRVIKVYNDKNESVEEREIFIWNQTVANLTLMAFGSSAPEILLSTIEACFKLDKIKDSDPKNSLGLYTILGSAAFNLFMISCVSIISVPSKEVKKIKDFGVFMITSIWSLFAYVWMLIVSVFITPGVIDIWEAVLTLIFFPFLVTMAYGQNNKWWNIHRKLFKLSSCCSKAPIEDTPIASINVESPLFDRRRSSLFLEYPMRFESGKQRLSVHSHMNIENCLVVYKKKNKLSIISSISNEDEENRITHAKGSEFEEGKCIVGKKTVQVSKDTSTVMVTITFTCSRSENEKASTEYHRVDYETRDGTARSNVHFKPTCGYILIPKDAHYHTSTVEIQLLTWAQIDDSIIDFFFIISSPVEEVIGSQSICRFCLHSLDENIFYLESPHFYGNEETNSVRINIQRDGNTDIGTKIRLKTQNGTAKGGSDISQENVDFEHFNSLVHFEPGQSTASANIPIKYTPNSFKSFVVTLDDLPNGSKFGDRTGAVCYLSYIIESEIIDVLKIEDRVTWTGQFFEAFQIEDYEDNEKSLMVHLKHFLSLPWKILFVSIPPRDYLNGYPSFILLIVFIGIMVVIIEQLSGLLGCTAGLKIAFTGLTLISIGTSIPDLFASRISALVEDSADDCIGNVTGSNSVNIFLGLGLPWTISAIYAKCYGFQYCIAIENMVETVFMFVSLALVAIGILIGRRLYIGGELGGSRVFKYTTGLLIGFVWITFIVACSLIIYNVIDFKLYPVETQCKKS